MSYENIIVKVVGNCGKVHSSFEEWQRCIPCETPKPLIPWWRDLVSFTPPPNDSPEATDTQ